MGGDVETDVRTGLPARPECMRDAAQPLLGDVGSQALDLLSLSVARKKVLDAVEARAGVVEEFVGDSVSVGVRAKNGRVVEQLEAHVDTDGKSGTDKGTDPVNPVVAGERAVHDGRAERTSGVERATGVVDRERLADEERKTDSERSDEGGTVLLNGKHEDGEDQHRGHEHLDPEALHDRGTATKSGGSTERTGSETIGKRSASKTTGDLSNGKEDTTDGGDATDENKGKSHSGVEEAARDTEEAPDSSTERAAKHERDEEAVVRSARAFRMFGANVRSQDN